MKRIGAWFCCAAGAALCLAILPETAWSKPGKPANAEQFTESTEVLVVEVPVQVLRGGEPVRGLTAADFELWEGREKQTITGFEVLDLTAAGPAAPGAERQTVVPPSARRRFLLLFDLSFSEPKSIEKARQAALSLVAGLHPTDLVGVATFQASRGADLVLGFTPDRQQLETALDQLGTAAKSADPLRLVMSQSPSDFVRETLGAIEGGGPTGGGKRGGSDSENPTAAEVSFVDNLIRESERTQQAAQKNNITELSESVGELARMLAGIQGRKHVVFLSEGYDSRFLYGTQDADEVARMDDASQNGEIWRVDSNTRYGSTKLVKVVDLMLDQLRRADCVIQAVDIAGMRAPGEEGYRAATADRQDGLFVLADSTGGELYSNFNDLSEAMESLLERNSVTYVLSYQPAKVRHDGGFHKLRVELRSSSEKTNRGAQIVHRPGYYAPKPFAEQAALERTLDTASQLTSGRAGGSIPVDVLAAPFARPGGKAYVPVLIEADGTGLLSGQKDEGVLPAEVYVYAFDGNGQVQDFFARSLGLDLGKVGPALRHSGLKMFGDLDLPAGSYSLRVLVRNGATGATSLRVVPLEVPAFTEAGPVLLPPFFPEPADRWLLVRENAAPPKDVDYPFMDRRSPFIPAAHPDLRSGEEARLSLVGWHLQPGDLQAEALILTAEGAAAGTGEIRVLERQIGGDGGPDRIAAGFRPPPLAPGDYHLLVTLTGPTGATQASTAEFTIASGGR
jgi:VWFA-related protein